MNLIDMPIKCPVAPLEFAFLADWHLRERGIRDRTELVFATPLDGCFTKPIASERLGSLLAEKEIELVTEFNAGEVDGVGGTLDLLRRPQARRSTCSSPSRCTAAAPTSSVHPDSATRSASSPPTSRRCRRRSSRTCSRSATSTDLPTSKAGSVTHFEAEVLVRERRALPHRAASSMNGYDGHANCFIETGFHEALLIDFNYDTEPLPGHFPTPIGLPLLRESHLNHLGKLAFQWIYWHALLPGRELPGLGPRMPTAGKEPRSRPPRLRGARDDNRH